MYRERLLSKTLKNALKSFPAVLVTGPRQSGKTTFLLHELGDQADYVSFDDPLKRRFALDDPRGFIAQFDGRRVVVLDEIQYAPHLLAYLKMDIDGSPDRKGKWVLTGSQQFQLMKDVNESLAGRIAILELLPFSLIEAAEAPPPLALTVSSGLYPSPFLAPESRDLWMAGYVTTYLERDVRQLQNIQNLKAFEHFVGVLAARHGQVFNTAEIARECGVSLPTVKSWAGVLEASYVCTLLPPFFRNLGKRLAKTPKLYFLDPGIVSYLTRQSDGAAALSGPLGGALFEGFVVSEAAKVYASLGKRADLSFFRSHDGLEVDLLIAIGGKQHLVEVKLTATPTSGHCQPLSNLRELLGSEADSEGTLVCRVERAMTLPNGNRALPWQQFTSWLYGKLARA